MDKSDDAPLSRSEFVKILLSTPSNCELRCQVLKVFQTFRDSKCMFNVTVLRCMQNITRYFSIYIYLYLYLFQLMLICLLAFYRALHRLQVFCSCSDWFVALSGSVMILLSLVPRPVRAIRVTRCGLEPSANPRRIFPTSLTGGFTSKIAEDDWERSCLFLHFPSS